MRTFVLIDKATNAHIGYGEAPIRSFMKTAPSELPKY